MAKTIEATEQKQSDFSAITMPLSDLMTRIDADIAKERDRKKAEEYPRIFQKYGEMSEYDAEKIYKAEQILAECEKCTGLPCQSRANGWIPVIGEVTTKFGVDIRVTPCKFTKEKNRQAKISRAFKMAKMPPRYIGKSFSDYEVTADNKTAVKAANELVENPQFGLYIYGKPGTGKTFLAAIIAQELVHKGKTVIFGDVPTLLEILRDSFNDKNIKITDLMNNLATVDLLVLDDLGTEIPTEWAVERIYSIINQRYNARIS